MGAVFSDICDLKAIDQPDEGRRCLTHEYSCGVTVSMFYEPVPDIRAAVEQAFEIAAFLEEAHKGFCKKSAAELRV